MKKLRLLIPLVALLVSCTRTTKVFTREELQQFSDDDILHPMGTYFWDEFSQCRDRYNLSDEESVLLGEWICFRGGTYNFFPNKLFVYRAARLKYKADPEKAIEGAMGIWSIRKHIVYVSIFGFDLSIGRTAQFFDKTATHEYVMVEPYEVKIVDTKEIMPAGYAGIFFNPIGLPKSLEEQLVIQRPTRAAQRATRETLRKGVGTIRALYYVHPITDSGKPEKTFNLFSLVPRFANENVSGLDIVTNPALVEEYFVRSLTFPYEDLSYFEAGVVPPVL
jgi:hypothetical protein